MRSRAVICSFVLFFVSCSGSSGINASKPVKEEIDQKAEDKKTEVQKEKFKYKNQLDCYLENPILLGKSELSVGQKITFSNVEFYKPIESAEFKGGSSNYEVILFALRSPGSIHPGAFLVGLDSEFKLTGNQAGIPLNDHSNSYKTHGEMNSSNGVDTYLTTRFSTSNRTGMPYDPYDARVTVSFEKDYLVGLKMELPQKIYREGSQIDYASELESVCLKNGIVKVEENLTN